MKQTQTEALLEHLNDVRGLSRDEEGYQFFADVRGEPWSRKKVYKVINQSGGVTSSDLDDVNPLRRCNNIRRAISSAERTSPGL